MRTIITLWPIDREFQEKIGIYNNGTVPNSLVGHVLKEVVEAGYEDVLSYVAEYEKHPGEEGYETGELEKVLCMHCRNVKKVKI
jgi:hypothetical protein